jgi:hypothetical protein
MRSQIIRPMNVSLVQSGVHQTDNDHPGWAPLSPESPESPVCGIFAGRWERPDGGQGASERLWAGLSRAGADHR